MNDLQPTEPHPYPKPAQAGIVRDLRPRGFKWIKAAAVLAANGTIQEAADAAEVKANAVRKWKRMPRFKALLDRYQREVERETVQSGIAAKNNRLRRLNDRWNRAHRVITERAEMAAADPAFALVPGGESGLIVRDQKTLGSGEYAQVVDTFEVDTALLKSIIDMEQQAAKEMGGQFEEAKPIGGPGAGLSISISFPVLSEADQKAVESAQVIDVLPGGRRLLQRPSDGAQR